MARTRIIQRSHDDNGMPHPSINHGQKRDGCGARLSCDTTFFKMHTTKSIQTKANQRRSIVQLVTVSQLVPLPVQTDSHLGLAPRIASSILVVGAEVLGPLLGLLLTVHVVRASLGSIQSIAQVGEH